MLTFLGFDSIEDFYTTLFIVFQFKLYKVVGIITTFLLFINHFIENYIWANVYAYWILILFILIDFIFGVINALKHRRFTYKKFPRFLIKIFVYTILLFVATQSAKVSQIMLFLPPLAYSIFIVSLVYSIWENAADIKIIPQIFLKILDRNIFEKFGVKFNGKKSNINFSISIKNKITTHLYDILFKSGADKVIYASFFTDSDNLTEYETYADIIEIYNENNKTLKHFITNIQPISKFNDLLLEISDNLQTKILTSEKKVLFDYQLKFLYVIRLENINTPLDSLIIIGSTDNNFELPPNFNLFLDDKLADIQKIICNLEDEK